MTQTPSSVAEQIGPSRDIDREKRSVDAIVRLYAIVMALALTAGVSTLFEAAAEAPTPPDISEWLNFLGFLATIIPFYHGVHVHIDVAHLYNKLDRLQPRRILGDFIFVFAEAIEFYVLALMLRNSDNFILALYALFITDSLWGIFALSAAGSSNDKTLQAWLAANIMTIAVLALVHFLFEMEWVTRAIFVILLARTILDYYVNDHFYFSFMKPPPIVNSAGGSRSPEDSAP